MSTCSNCYKNISLLTKEYDCAICGKHICAHCTHKWKENVRQFRILLDVEPHDPFFGNWYLPICPQCLGTMVSENQKLEDVWEDCEDVEIVSSRYKGHKKFIARSEMPIKSNFYRKRDDATHELQAFAKYYERDMILDFKYERVEESETSDSGKGTHYYTTWSCSGIAVKKP